MSAYTEAFARIIRERGLLHPAMVSHKLSPAAFARLGEALRAAKAQARREARGV